MVHRLHTKCRLTKNSAAPKRTFSSALVSAEWRAQRENDRREERGIWAGHSKRIVGPPDSGSAQPADRTLYRVPTFDPSRPLISSLRRFLTLAPACWPRGKIPPHPS